MKKNGNESVVSSVWDGLSERKIQAVNFKILNPDATYEEIAAELDIPKQTIGNWRLNQIVAEIRADSGKAITDYADRLAIKAMRVLESQMDSADERVAQAAAKEVLDRAIGKSTQRSEVTGKGGEAIEVKHTLLSDLNDDELDDIINS